MEKPPHRVTPGPDGFTGEFHPTLKEEVTPAPHKLFRKPEAERARAAHSRACLVGHGEKTKDVTRKGKLRADIPHERGCEDLQQNFSGPKPTTW